MENFTNQSAFDIVWQKFVVEEAPLAFKTSAEGDVVCQNLTLKGHRCAAASLVPVDVIRSWGDSRNEQSMVNGYLCSRGLKDPFIDDIRHCHDQAAFGNILNDKTLGKAVKDESFNKIKINLTFLAEKYGLRIPDENPQQKQEI